MPEITKQKLEELQITGSIHTVQIACEYFDKDQIETRELIAKKVIQGIKWDIRYEMFSVIINVNKYTNKDLFTFSEFSDAMEEITGIIRSGKWYFIRVDFRLDNYEPGSFKKYFKLHKCFIRSVCRFEGIKQNYFESIGDTSKRHSILGKGSEIELEYYDRAKKSRDTQNTTEKAIARFEIRSLTNDLSRSRKRLKVDAGSDEYKVVYDAFNKRWIDRLKFEKEDLEKVYAWQNKLLIEQYTTMPERRTETARTKLQRFIENENSYIFTRKQLSDLLTELGYAGSYNRESAAQSKADRFDKLIGIEYISKNSMDYASNKFISAINQYFTS